MAEPLEQAPAWIRTSATPPAELAAMRAEALAEALAEIARWRRGEPSRVTTSEELFAWLGALDAGDDEDG